MTETETQHHEHHHDANSELLTSFWLLGLKFLLATYPFLLTWAGWITIQAVQTEVLRRNVLTKAEIHLIQAEAKAEITQQRLQHTAELQTQIESLKISMAAIQANQTQMIAQFEAWKTKGE